MASRFDLLCHTACAAWDRRIDVTVDQLEADLIDDLLNAAATEESTSAALGKIDSDVASNYENGDGGIFFASADTSTVLCTLLPEP